MTDTHRWLPRYTNTAIETDPLEVMLAQREAEEARAKEQIAKGKTYTEPADRELLRGIPCEGFGGAIHRSAPHHEAGNGNLDGPHRLRSIR